MKFICGTSFNPVSTQIIPLGFCFLSVIYFYSSLQAMKTTRSRRCESAWKPNSGYWHLLTITHPLGRYSALPPLRVSSLFLLWHHAGVPGRPEITGFTKPAMEGDVITLTCTTSGSKPAANIRWFRNDKEVQGKRVVWIPPSAVSPVSICTVSETSLLSNWSAQPLLLLLLQCIVLVFVHCSFVLGGFLQVPWTAWLVANVAAVAGGACDVVWTSAVHISLRDWGVDVLTKCPVCFSRTCGFTPCPGHPVLFGFFLWRDEIKNNRKNNFLFTQRRHTLNLLKYTN